MQTPIAYNRSGNRRRMAVIAQKDKLIEKATKWYDTTFPLYIFNKENFKYDKA